MQFVIARRVNHEVFLCSRRGPRGPGPPQSPEFTHRIARRATPLSPMAQRPPRIFHMHYCASAIYGRGLNRPPGRNGSSLLPGPLASFFANRTGLFVLGGPGAGCGISTGFPKAAVGHGRTWPLVAQPPDLPWAWGHAGPAGQRQAP